jgi:hypothetical protein
LQDSYRISNNLFHNKQSFIHRNWKDSAVVHRPRGTSGLL